MVKLYIIRQNNLDVETAVFQRSQEEIYKRKCNEERPQLSILCLDLKLIYTETFIHLHSSMLFEAGGKDWVGIKISIFCLRERILISCPSLSTLRFKSYSVLMKGTIAINHSKGVFVFFKIQLTNLIDIKRKRLLLSGSCLLRHFQSTNMKDSNFMCSKLVQTKKSRK